MVSRRTLLGAGAVAGLAHALDRGVTFFDCAESYRFGWAEEAMGEGLKGVRDKVILTSKTKAAASDTAKDMMAALEGSLRRMQTDYLDIRTCTTGLNTLFILWPFSRICRLCWTRHGARTSVSSP